MSTDACLSAIVRYIAVLLLLCSQAQHSTGLRDTTDFKQLKRQELNNPSRGAYDKPPNDCSKDSQLLTPRTTAAEAPPHRLLQQEHAGAWMHSTSIAGSSQRRALVSLLVDTAQQEYIQGAEVLAKSSLRHAPGYFDARLLLLLIGRQYNESVLEQARLAGWRLQWVEPITPPHPSSFARFRDQFVKLHLWNLEEYHQVVYMDLDVAFVAPLTGHFISQAAYPTNCKIWAARDIRAGVWQDGFNMGVAGIIPSKAEFARLMDLLQNDGVQYEHVMSEQGFLNKVYTAATGEWCELDFEKNANLAAYTQVPTYWKSTSPQVIHYTMNKPWGCGSDYRTMCDLWKTERASAAQPVTVVSAYYIGQNKHGESKYNEWGKNFMAHKVPVVFFTDMPEAVPGLQERDPTITKIVTMDSPSFFMSHKMFDWSKQLQLDPEKAIHSEHVFKVWLEKTNWVTTAIGLNPYHSDHYVWVDYGCFRTDVWQDKWVVHAERFPADVDRMLLMNTPVHDSRKLIAGPIFGGSTHAWKLWSSAFYNAVQRQYRKDVFIGDDQIPMSMVAARHPGLVCRIEPQTVNGSDYWFFLQWYLAGKAPVQQCAASRLPMPS